MIKKIKKIMLCKKMTKMKGQKSVLFFYAVTETASSFNRIEILPFKTAILLSGSFVTTVLCRDMYLGLFTAICYAATTVIAFSRGYFNQHDLPGIVFITTDLCQDLYMCFVVTLQSFCHVFTISILLMEYRSFSVDLLQNLHCVSRSQRIVKFTTIYSIIFGVYQITGYIM